MVWLIVRAVLSKFISKTVTSGHSIRPQKTESTMTVRAGQRRRESRPTQTSLGGCVSAGQVQIVQKNKHTIGFIYRLVTRI